MFVGDLEPWYFFIFIFPGYESAMNGMKRDCSKKKLTHHLSILVRVM